MKKDITHIAVDPSFAGHIPFDPVEPEKNLLRAILLSAVQDAKKEGHVAEEAKLYFLNTSEDYIFSFHSICHVLSVDPKSILHLAGLS